MSEAETTASEVRCPECQLFNYQIVVKWYPMAGGVMLKCANELCGRTFGGRYDSLEICEVGGGKEQ